MKRYAFGLLAVCLLAGCGSSEQATSETTTSESTTTTRPSSVGSSAIETPPPVDVPASVDPACTPAPATYTDQINGAFTESGNLLGEAYVVEGNGLGYLGANIYDESGERVSSADVWAYSDTGLFALSSDARSRTSVADGRDILDASAGDEYGTLVEQCVVTALRNANAGR